jgi:hypothetical protein
MHRTATASVLLAACLSLPPAPALAQQPAGGAIGTDGCALAELREGAWGMIPRSVQTRALERWEAAAARLYGQAFADATASARRGRHTICAVDDGSIAGAIWCEIIARPCGPQAAQGTGGPIDWMPGY